MDVNLVIASWNSCSTLVDWSYGGLGDDPCAHLVVPSLGQLLDELGRVVDEVVPKNAMPLTQPVVVVEQEVGESTTHT